MKKITVSVDDETHRIAVAKAAEKGTSVSALVRNYLDGLVKDESEAEDPVDEREKPEKTLSESSAAIRAGDRGLYPGRNLTSAELHDRNALLFADGYAYHKLMGMVINTDNAKKIETLFREHLERNFQGTSLKFDPIIVEPTYDQYDRDTFKVTVVFDGDFDDLKPGTLNAITSDMVDEYEAMGIFTTVVDGYVSKEEWDMRDELMAPEPWEILDPSEFGHLEDC